MGGLHLFYFPFLRDGPLPTQPASSYPMEKSFAHARWIRKVVSYHVTKLGFDALRGKRADGLFPLRQTCRNKPRFVRIRSIYEVTIDIAEIFRIGKVVLWTRVQ